MSERTFFPVAPVTTSEPVTVSALTVTIVNINLPKPRKGGPIGVTVESVAQILEGLELVRLVSSTTDTVTVLLQNTALTQQSGVIHVIAY